MKSYKHIKHQLKQFGETCKPGSEEDFKRQLHLKLEKAKVKQSQKRSFFRVPVIAGVGFAAVLVFFLSTFFIGNVDKIDDSAISQTEIETDKPVEVILNYDAVKDLKDIKIHFKLDEGVAFYSDSPSIEALKEYTWTGDLKKGANKIPFMVSVKKDGVWKINTTTEFEGYIHEHRIELKVSEGKIAVAYYKSQTPVSETVL